METNVALVQVLNIVVPIVLTILTGVFVTYFTYLMVKGVKTMKAKMGEELYDKMMSLADLVVHAAEQVGLTAKAKGEVLDKKKWAIEQLQILAKQYGLDGIDIAAWDSIIEGILGRINFGDVFDGKFTDTKQ